ncbi:CusA/CzcA family heavy metal efflux RND transporter [Hymenobacter jeollabukensis]|uniref:CusA/CzcA family heavy metal efflux RND transporter n=1 Tax=Hymenobacter jeollabukensis TaxID=2025313 RepID=A0A5R8WQL5_9BACT|nr:CusA/CzcA family heavy metal efflux RND transporter [Hymenobacter jeollabukensis]TLM93037.1 CusA/CzcA family heavy metal efflux RND transporter [Hymenobacter jeollabukensis]
MFNKLIMLSLRHKLGVGIGVAALLAWGIYALRHLPIDAVPDITNNQVIVFTVSPSLSAADVERLVTFPVEQSMATIPGREEVRSFSRAGLSVVTIVFGDEVDNYWARQQVAERMRAAEAQIPPGLGQPEMGPATTGLGEIYQYAIRVKPGFEKKYSLAELRTLQDWVIRRQLLGTTGVADVSSFGGYLRQYEVAIAPDRLRSFGLTIADMQTALSRNNGNAGGGYLVRGPQAWFIRTEGLAQSESDIGRAVVRPAAPGRGPVLVRDVAEVRPGAAPRFGAMIRNHTGETVGGLVLMLRGANSSEVVKAVKEKMAAIEKTLPPGLEIRPFIDRTKLVDQAIHTVEKNLAEGALIVIFVLVLFLGNLRAGLLVASVIPLAMLFAIAMMQVFGVSGNLMSLGAIDFGLIVDGAVIIVEATMHRLASRFGHAHGDGEIPLTNEDLTPAEMDEEVYDAASRIQQSASFGQFIILMVYLPILALVGIEGKMFRPMAQTVAFAILGAFILSLTYVPVMSALVLRKGVRGGGWSDRVLARLATRYRRLVTRVLGVPRLIVGTAVLLLVGAALLLGTLGGEFIPTLEEGDFAVETRVLPGSSLDHTARQAQLAADILKEQFPEVKEVVAKVGSSEIPVDPMPLEACDLIIVLKDRKEWTTAHNREDLAAKMERALSVLPGVTYSFQQPIQMRFNELISGARQDVVIKIYGEDLDQLAGYARRVGAVVRQVPGAADLYVEQATGLAQIVVQPDRERLAQFGLSVQDLNQSIEAAFAGAGAGQVFEGDRRFDLVVRLADEYRHDISQVRALNVPLPGGGQVPLEQVARVDYQVGPGQIQRDNAQRRITVGFNVRGRDVESVVQDVQAAVQRQVHFAPGYVTTYGGQFENLRQANARLAVAVPAALLMIFGLLYLTFGSLRQALLIFTAIPLAAVGGVLALWLRGLPFSISAGVGFIALFGVAVLNGIVLLSAFNHLRDEGLRDVRERVLRGTEERLRPVLMTATVASLGFLPMALAGTAGAEVQRPLATVVIGGLVSATLLTLLVLPVLYYLSESEGGFWRNLLGRRPQAAPAVAAGLLLLALTSPAAAQTPDPATAPRAAAASSVAVPEGPLTAAGAVQTALGRSGDIRAATYQLSARSAVRGAVWELPRTTVQAGVGQFNSPYLDNQFSLAQPLPALGRIRALTGLAEAQVSLAESELDLRRAELRRQVRLTYQQAVYARHRLVLLRAQDSLSREFRRAAELRFRTGEAARIEPATALVQQGETRVARQRTRADYVAARRQLQALLQLPTAPAPADSLLLPLPVPAELAAILPDTLLTTPADTSRSAADPTARVLARQAAERQAAALVELRSRRPELGLTYLNQSLRGNIQYKGTERFYGPADRFQAAQLSLSVPLLTRPYKAREQAARLQTLAAEAAYRRRVAEVAASQAALLNRLREQQERMQFYQQTGLPQAALILRLASKGWRAGEMPFAEYLLHAERAQRLRTDYLDAVLAYNQTVLEVEYLLGRTD